MYGLIDCHNNTKAIFLCRPNYKLIELAVSDICEYIDIEDINILRFTDYYFVAVKSNIGSKYFTILKIDTYDNQLPTYNNDSLNVIKIIEKQTSLFPVWFLPLLWVVFITVFYIVVITAS